MTTQLATSLIKIKVAFFYSSAFTLIATALAKFYSATGKVKLLVTADPLLHIDYGVLLSTVAAVEMAVAVVLLFSQSDKLKYLSLLWLSLNFMLYRLGFWFIGLPLKQCACLGNLTDTLHLKPDLVENVMQGVVLYLFIGSLLGLLSLMRQGRLGEHGPSSPVELAAKRGVSA